MNPTVRRQQQDAPELLAPAPARAMAVREASRRQARISQEQSGQVPLPSLVPPSMQPGQPVPQLVSAETLDQLTHLMTERITRGDTELARRIEQVEGARERSFTDQDLELRTRALAGAKDHVRRLLASKDHQGIALTVEQRVDYELRIARFLLGQE
jgi:hypothetical protein